MGPPHVHSRKIPWAVAGLGLLLLQGICPSAFDLPEPPCHPPSTWVQQTLAFPEELAGRYHHITATVRGKIYVGLGNTGDTVLQDWWAFDPEKRAWTRLPDFPGPPRRLAFVFVIGDDIYVGGGDALNETLHADVYTYRVTTQTWHAVASLPHPLSAAAATSDGRYGYVFGGRSPRGNRPEILRYDPAYDTWTVLDTVPGGLGRVSPFILHVSGSLYLGTGRVTPTLYLQDFYRYNPYTRTWEVLENHPVPVYQGTPLQVGPRIVILGGYLPVSRPTDRYHAYNLTTQTWEALSPFPDGPRSDLKGGVIGTTLHAGLGIRPDSSLPVDWWTYCFGDASPP